MNLKKTFLTAVAAATLLVAGTSGAMARDRDHDGRGDRHWAERHDHDGYRDAHRHGRHYNRHYPRHYVTHARVYDVIRAHHHRYIGAPYWYRGVYVIRTYDPYGRVVLVRIDPYTGAWGGIYLRF
jgi:hypothetical protein